MNSAFLDYFRCPEEFVKFGAAQNLGQAPGFFRLGKEITCFGRGAGPVAAASDGAIPDSLSLMQTRGDEFILPFDPDEVVENLRSEKYIASGKASSFAKNLIRKTYYGARPFLSVAVRKHFQRFHLRERKNIEFPRWPIDKTVDLLCSELMGLAIQGNGNQRVPFVWFWPDEFTGCALMTHDVEHEEGRAFCGSLMDLDAKYGIHASFQVVPEERYTVSDDFLESIRSRGFELNVHDLNHDGQLFASRDQFQKRSRSINEYARKWRADGFRAGGMYRNSEWSSALQFVYDMSFPSASHLEPQRGGCCTVMPYFLGGLVELPLTTTQDYSLFHILAQHSIDTWKQQLDYIAESNGLATFIVHPDYVIESGARRIYEQLLEYLSDHCNRKKIWQPLPRDVARWWNERSRMRVEQSNGSWKVTGPGSERARVAFAQIEDGRITYHVDRVPCRESIA